MSSHLISKTHVRSHGNNLRALVKAALLDRSERRFQGESMTSLHDLIEVLDRVFRRCEDLSTRSLLFTGLDGLEGTAAEYEGSLQELIFVTYRKRDHGNE